MNAVRKMNELEPPPPSHNSNHLIAIEPEPSGYQHDVVTATGNEQQWINDTMHSATTNITKVQDQHTIDANTEKYTLFFCTLQAQSDFSTRLQQAKR